MPDNLIQQELSIITQGLKKEDIEKNKKESERIAKKRVKLGLILNELGEKNNIKVDEQEIKTEIQKQIQSMPNQQKQVLEYYQKNPTAAASLKGSIYEEKIINLIRQKTKKMKKTVSLNEAEKILKEDFSSKNQPSVPREKTDIKKPKKTTKSPEFKKKIRKK